MTSEMDSAGFGDKPASKRITSAGVLDTAAKVCGSVSVCATTSRSFSSAKIFPMPTRKIASESATINRTGVCMTSTEVEWGLAPALSEDRSISWRGTDMPECSERLELVFIDYNRHGASSRLFVTSNDSSLALHEHVAVRSQHVPRHRHREFNG